ncbi:MAG: SDR family NAD(P)-dependent oxidoreductase [Eubacterium sp.]|nr:SDR family NAD(P)-dependent oxidoreductase [Eubacterium sp.]
MIAIVTGAGSGMGSQMVRHIVTDKVKVDEIWVLGRRRNRLESLQDQYPGTRFRPVTIDLKSRDEREAFGNLLKQEKPRIRIFVHAAGFGIMGRIDEIPVSEAEEMVDVNIEACVSLTGYVLPYMEEGGQMIYFASSAAFLPQPGFAVYAASKAFVLSYVRALRAECRGRLLRITAVCPGAVKTEFFDRAAAGHELPAYKKLVMADSAKVAKKAWEDNRRNREISVYGFLMKLFHIAAKIIPHRLFLRFLR